MNEHSEPAAPIAAVVAANCRLLRADRKADEVAKAAAQVGLKWGTGRIADLEAGRVSPTLPTLLALCQAFSNLLGRPVALADLLAGPTASQVVVTDGLVVDLGSIQAALGGAPVDLANVAPPVVGMMASAAAAVAAGGGEDPQRRRVLFAVWSGFGEAEKRAARSLGVTKEDAVATMADLWGRSLSEERDHRAAPGATAAERGHVARQLKAELAAALRTPGPLARPKGAWSTADDADQLEREEVSGGHN